MWPHSTGLVVFRGALFLSVGNDLSFHTKQKPVLPWLLLFKVAIACSFPTGCSQDCCKGLEATSAPHAEACRRHAHQVPAPSCFVSAQDKGSKL